MAVIQIPSAEELIDKIDAILSTAEHEELWYIYLYMKSFEKRGSKDGDHCRK